MLDILHKPAPGLHIHFVAVNECDKKHFAKMHYKILKKEKMGLEFRTSEREALINFDKFYLSNACIFATINMHAYTTNTCVFI